ncbi:hypothetical protein GCM10023185_44600 [Hymenobacter saemangeumensis]|uniref:DUF4890 domain-containing protein n=1 Tax=Hymenobacter saemangeumensis TaxID=1084522 RepID=A0ABP8ISQ1_9BACT
MKKTLLLLAALAFATAGTTFAQSSNAAAPAKMKVKEKKDKKTPEQKADHRAAKMAKELGLSPDQEARIEQILLARQQEMKALKEKTAGNGRAAHTEKKALRERYDAKFKDVLTAEQYAKFLQLRDEHKDDDGPGHGHGNGKMKMKEKS